jgi:hypothetical protein
MEWQARSSRYREYYQIVIKIFLRVLPVSWKKFIVFTGRNYQPTKTEFIQWHNENVYKG